MAKTTIQISDQTKDRLDECKLSDESYDAALSRILGDEGTPLWSEQELRDLARAEAEEVVEEVATRGL